MFSGLRRATRLWAFMGLVGIPALVYLDLLHGWRWAPANPIYDQMIVSVYVALGLVAAVIADEAEHHGAFLWFVAISSFTHGGVMLYHAVLTPGHLCHLLGDVWILAGGWSIAAPLRAHGIGIRKAATLGSGETDLQGPHQPAR